VKVKAYRTVDGKNIYGSYSDIKSIKLKGPKTTVSGLSTSLSKTAGLSLKDTIEISPAYGRKVYLQRYDSEKKTWVTKVTYTAPETKTGSVKLVYPSEWYNQVSSKWRVYIPATDKGNSYTSSTINIKAKRVYENPKGYIQLKEKINVSGGGKDLVRGTMGLRVAKVQRRLGMGHVWETVGPTTISRVMAFQRANGLKATGVVNLATWRKMGFSESSWYTLDTYVTPVKTKLTDTKEDLIEKMISTAKSYLGTEYVVGAAGVPGSGIDCSGLVMQAMYSVGIDPSPISVTRHTQPGYEYESRNLWKLSTLKTVSKPKRGDLVFYKNSSGTIIHVAIYLGNDKVIESWPEEVVEWPLIHPERPLIKGYKRIFG
ncbi:MAG: NlpC/P60 family protein, partial [Terrisporobacter sp.]|uniref:C40 family peptidase n=1 Tax=Terrisporobacter sp. TaxID=1965305 RepID=UPI002A90AC19